jgi:hypothetical protein
MDHVICSVAVQAPLRERGTILLAAIHMLTISNLNYIARVVALGCLAGVPVAARTLEWRSNVVFENPGEGRTQTKWLDPAVVSEAGLNIMTVAKGRPPHCAITWEDFDPNILPTGSDSRAWVEALGETIGGDLRHP